jgi:NAD(P)-dependent dehydrogenase (short-subunit alcohol dehydrogenase family)
MLLEGKVAVVTGAGSGIGAAIARLFAVEGAKVVLGDLAESGAALAAELAAEGFQVTFQRVDVTDESSVAGLMQAAVTKFGRLDILVANAGIPERKAPIHELDLADWRRVIDVDLTGVAICNKFAAGAMLATGGGAIVNMASILGHVGQENSNAYSAAKAAVVNLTRSVALTYARQGIRVNCVSPGYVDTPLLAKLPEATRQNMLLRQPIGRLGRPEEIAQVVAFLASDRASIITGACINADGGYTAI